MGVAAGFIDARTGQALELNVPFGKQRTFQIWGFAHSNGCPNILSLLNLQKGALPGNAKSTGFLIGETTVDIASRNITLDIPLSYQYGVNKVFCGQLPTPSTKITAMTYGSGFAAPTLLGTRATASSAFPSITSKNQEACLYFTTTAAQPSVKCTVISQINSGTPATTSLPCGPGTLPASAGTCTLPSNGYVVSIAPQATAGAGSTTSVSVAVDVTDAGYSIKAPTASAAWAVDLVVPTLSLNYILPGKQDPNTGFWYTNSINPSINVAINKPGTVLETHTMGAPTSCGYTAYAGNVNCVISPSFSSVAATYNVSLTAQDNVGNQTAAPTALTVKTDFIAPTVTLDPADGWLFGGNLTSTPTGPSATIAIPSATDAGAIDPNNYYCTFDGVLTSLCPATNVGVSWLTSGIPQRAGKHTLTVLAYDFAGNVTGPNNYNVYIDSLFNMPALGRLITGSTPLTDESSSTGASVPATLPGNSGFESPGQAALDAVGDGSTGYLYVADSANNRVLAFEWDIAHMALRSHAAVAVYGQASMYSHGSGNGTANIWNSTTLTYAQMDGPSGVALLRTSSNNLKLFVSDSNNNRVLRFDVTNGPALKIPDAIYGQTSLTGNLANVDGTNAQQGLYKPLGLAASNTTRQLFVVDSNNCRVAVFDGEAAGSGGPLLGPTVLYHIAANGNQTTAAPALFCTPIATMNSLRLPVAVSIDEPASASNLTTQAVPTNPALPPRVYVSDVQGHRILYWDLNGFTIGTGASPPATQSISIGANTFLAVQYFRSANKGYLAASHRAGGEIYELTSSGYVYQANLKFGDGNLGTAQNRTNYATFLSWSPIANALFMADNGNNRMTLWQTVGLTDNMAMIDLLGHTDFLGQRVSYVSGAKNNPNDATLNGPTYTTIDTLYNRVYVSDSMNNRITIYRLDPTTYRPQIPYTAIGVIGVPYNISGDLLLDSPTTALSASPSTLNNPGQLVVDPSGNLYIADTGNNRVLRFPTGTSTLPPVLQANLVFGQSSSSSSGTGTTTSEMNAPRGLAYDAASSNLYVSDSGNNRILIFNTLSPTSGQAATQSWGTSGAPPTAETFNAPRGLAFTERTGNLNRGLFVADTGNNRVMYFDLSTSTNGLPYPTLPSSMVPGASLCYGHHGMTAAATCTSASANGVGAGVTDYGFDNPTGVYVQSISSPPKLFVADQNNGRVGVFDLSNTANLPLNASSYNGHVMYHAMGVTGLLLSSPATGIPSDSWIKSPIGISGVTPLNGNPSLLYINDSGWHRVGVYEVP